MTSRRRALPLVASAALLPLSAPAGATPDRDDQRELARGASVVVGEGPCDDGRRPTEDVRCEFHIVWWMQSARAPKDQPDLPAKS